MSWRALTETDVLDRLANDERDTYESAGEGEGATPRLPGIMMQVTNLIRGAIAQNSENYLGDDGTLPEGAIFHAATLCRLGLVGSQPTEEGQTSTRQREEAAALKYVERIEDKKITFPSEPEVPREASGGEYGGKCLMEF